MPKAGLTAIAVVLDRSGSMDTLKQDVIGGFNTFLEEQKKALGEAQMTVVLFDDEYLFLNKATKIADVQPLTDTTYVPRGGTALYDALGRTINEVVASAAMLPEAERPSKTLFVVVTDGQENRSKEFELGRIRKLIEDQTKAGWEFLFLAAGLDQFSEAVQMGYAQQGYLNVGHDSKGMTRGLVGAAVYASAIRAQSLSGGGEKCMMSYADAATQADALLAARHAQSNTSDHITTGGGTGKP